MSIHTTTHDGTRQPLQKTVSKGTIVPVFAVSTARYADPKPFPGILCGSV